ncbi:MAG: toll/interleukin-1 receptor domain-containing protein [Leptolyngbyaceae cyanobacterium MO_188.B28]|nr:toll/interleukin-1 receptor domain-containing protein [Leptolyngbyaceae cyanobacterium MO_188.B28]
MVQPSPRRSGSTSPFDPLKSNDVFISYSRKDKAFVETLDAAFRKVDRDPWVDWDDIRKGEDWWRSIQRGIEAAETFLFVVSPDSVSSEVCRDEIEYATQCNKRFLPLVRREGFDMQHVHSSISRHNWLFFREADDFKAAFEELLKALDTDLEHVRGHTRLLVRSLEWLNQGRDSSYLLRGSDLQDGQQWLTLGINKDPSPTDSHVAYINASLDAETAMLRARQRAKWIVVLTTVLANLAFVAGGLSWLYFRMLDIAREQVKDSMEDALAGAIEGIDGDDFAELAGVELPPGQDEPFDHPLYQDHQNWLLTVNELVPLAEPATYIWDAKADEVFSIGDVYRITDSERAHGFRESKPSHPEMLDGFEEVSIEWDPYEDDFRTLVAIYGPIQNSAGESVGMMELEYDATYVTEVAGEIGVAIGVACIIAFIWLVISSWLILRATQPPHETAARDRPPQNP